VPFIGVAVGTGVSVGTSVNVGDKVGVFVGVSVGILVGFSVGMGVIVGPSNSPGPHAVNTRQPKQTMPRISTGTICFLIFFTSRNKTGAFKLELSIQELIERLIVSIPSLPQLQKGRAFSLYEVENFQMTINFL
jgi:hypothetical protein